MVRSNVHLLMSFHGKSFFPVLSLLYVFSYIIVRLIYIVSSIEHQAVIRLHETHVSHRPSVVSRQYKCYSSHGVDQIFLPLSGFFSSISAWIVAALESVVRSLLVWRKNVKNAMERVLPSIINVATTRQPFFHGQYALLPRNNVLAAIIKQ